MTSPDADRDSVFRMFFDSVSFVDLTHPLDDDAPRWPGDPPFRHRVEFEGALDDGRHYFIDAFAMGSHVGTHLDAPRHWNREGDTVERLSLERLIGRAICLDFSNPANSTSGNHDTETSSFPPLPPKDLTDPTDPADRVVDAQDLRRWEARYGAIPHGRIVLIRTDHARHWPDPQRYYGAHGDDDPARARLRFPGLSLDAARFLVEERGTPALGLDTPGVDPGRSEDLPVHEYLAARGVPAFENLTNLDRLPLPGGDFAVAALPLPIRGGSGAPIRVVAMIERHAIRDSSKPPEMD